MTSKILSYAGVKPPAFLIVERVEFSVLPEVQVNQLDVPLKNGSYFINKKHGVRTFTVECVINSNNKDGVMYDADQLAEWLNYNSPQPLVFRDKPDIAYYCIVNNSIDITSFSNSGRGQIQFLALDPYGHGNERIYQFFPTSSVPYGFMNNGNTDTYPRMEFEFTEDSTEFSIISGDEFLYFGSPVEAGVNESVDANPLVMNEEFASLDGWSTAISVEDGNVDGSFRSNGWSISLVDDFDDSLYNRYVGPSLIKALPYPVQDFKS